MADSAPIETRQKYFDDPRIACQYGAKCYQKNPEHQQKYKHPPPKRANKDATQPPKKRLKMAPDDKPKPTNVPEVALAADQPAGLSPKSPAKVEELNRPDLGRTDKDFNVKHFINEKFLVDMPEDFYEFWAFCKSMNAKRPEEALKEFGLTLVGPYDVLAGKFNDVAEQPQENYLIHWRYYHDPPECQTVLKGNDKTGYHVCYFRDSPLEPPVCLVANAANENGEFVVMGDNIFASLHLYLETFQNTFDPFKKMKVGQLQKALKRRAEELELKLNARTERVKDRSKRIVARTYNKIGIVVPFNKKTQVGYRELTLSNKELWKLLNDIQSAQPDQRASLLSKLQDLLTNVTIATDECDFGAGIELGQDILAHGVDCLNRTISQCLATNYRLIQREAFAQIAEAHMKNRRRGPNLSII